MCKLIFTLITRALGERKPPPTPKFQPKVIQSGFLSDLSQNVVDALSCRRQSFRQVYGTNRPLIMRKILTNVQKSPILQWWRKWSDLEFILESGSPL